MAAPVTHWQYVVNSMRSQNLLKSIKNWLYQQQPEYILLIIDLSKLVIFRFFVDMFSCGDRSVIATQDVQQLLNVCQAPANTQSLQGSCLKPVSSYFYHLLFCLLPCLWFIKLGLLIKFWKCISQSFSIHQRLLQLLWLMWGFATRILWSCPIVLLPIKQIYLLLHIKSTNFEKVPYLIPSDLSDSLHMRSKIYMTRKCKISVLNCQYLTSYGLLTNIEGTQSCQTM